MKNTFSCHPAPASDPTHSGQQSDPNETEGLESNRKIAVNRVMTKQPLSNNRLSLAVAPIAAILTAENQKAGGKQLGSRRQS